MSATDNGNGSSLNKSRRSFGEWAQDSVLLLFSIGLVLGIGGILSLNLLSSQVLVTEGEVATEDVYAPSSIKYVSDVLTEQRRQQAIAGVSDQFTPTDVSIGRAQTNVAHEIFSFIDVVRADPVTDADTKTAYLQAITNLELDSAVAADLLSLPEQDYLDAKTDILRIIEGGDAGGYSGHAIE